MNRFIFILSLFLLFSVATESQIYKCKKGNVSFFSKAPIEDIDAHGTLSSALNTQTNEIAFIVRIGSFQFKKAKMQTDFNEDYLESDKYPNAVYKGKINSNINWKKDGTYKVTSKGTLTIHNISKERTDTATLIIENGIITLQSSFWVRVADHDIKIPTLVIEKIAEVVNVKFTCEYHLSEGKTDLLFCPVRTF